MPAKYEYKFVRIGEGWWRAKSSAEERYQEVIRQYAEQGWRLVQIFAPGIGLYGRANYYELILEREVSE